MIDIYRNHNRHQATSRLVCEIIFNQEFSDLLEELGNLYKIYGINNPEQEAFQDAFYSILNSKENSSKALTVSR